MKQTEEQIDVLDELCCEWESNLNVLDNCQCDICRLQREETDRWRAALLKQLDGDEDGSEDE